MQKKYNDLREIALNAVPWKKLHNPDYPNTFVRWAENTETAFPKELAELVKKRSAAYLDYKQYYEAALENYAKQNEVIESYKEIVDKKEQYAKILEKRIKAFEKQKDTMPQNKVTLEQEKPLHKKERESLRKMFIGMAANYYKPERLINETIKAKDISDDLLRDYGIQVNDDTIRPHLKESLKYIEKIAAEQK